MVQPAVPGAEGTGWYGIVIGTTPLIDSSLQHCVRRPMKNLRTLVVAFVVPVLILGIFAVSMALAGGNAGKSSICHWASHKYVEISVSNNAVPAHMRHGDVLPDEYGDCP